MNDVLKMLIYLSEKAGENKSLETRQEDLFAELRSQGVNVDKIRELFHMLQQVLETPERQLAEYPPQSHAGLRVFTSAECTKLSKKNRGFLLTLEQIGVLTPTTRELVLDQLMHIKPSEINLKKIKWITLMVLLDQPDKYETPCMERFFLNEECGLQH